MSVRKIRMADGAELSVRIVGRGSSVLMLPGLGMTSSQWLPFVAPLLRRHRFVMPDYRGFGASLRVPPREGDLFEGHAADVKDLVAALDLQDHALVGYSLGASTSLHLLRDGAFGGVRRYLHIDQSPFVGKTDEWSFGLLGSRQPELSELCFAALAKLDAHPEIEWLDALPQKTRRALLDDMARASVALALPSLTMPALHAVFASPSKIVRSFPLTSVPHLRKVLEAYGRCRHDYRDALRDCTTPIEVIIGERSALYDPRGQLAIAELARDVKVHRWEGTGHLAPFAEPLRFARTLNAFLEGGSRS